MPLTDKQQAILVFIAFALPAVGAWATIGFPTDRLALGALVAALIAGALLAIKELWGISPAPLAPSSKGNSANT
jgi:hypothetical protein